MNKKEEGKLIVFEGVENSGKSTQIEYFAERLRKIGINFILTKEPRGEIREKLKYGNPTPDEELGLFLEDRESHFRELVIPSLKEGIWVLVDRCSPSTVAYQCYGRGFDLEYVKQRDRVARKDKDFDLVILLDMNPAESMKRAEKGDRFEKEKIDFHQRVRQGYLEQARLDSARQANESPSKWLVIDAKKKKEKIAEIIWKEIKKKFRV